jgi:hypothetical protein
VSRCVTNSEQNTESLSEYMEAMLQLIGSCTRKEDAAYGEVKAFLNVMTQRYSSTLLDIMKGPEHTKLLEGLAHVIAADSGSYRNDVLAAISGRLFSGSEIDLMADISSYLAVLQRLVDSDPRPFPRDILLWLFALTEDGPPALLPVDLGRLLAVCLALSGHLSGQNKVDIFPSWRPVSSNPLLSSSSRHCREKPYSSASMGSRNAPSLRQLWISNFRARPLTQTPRQSSHN